MAIVEQSFFDLNKKVRSATDERLKNLFEIKKRQAGQIDSKSRRLIEDIERVVRRGGKRLRPTLAAVGYRALGGDDFELVMDAALSVELLHAMMLVHDDVIDRDATRHGGDNIMGIYRKRLSKSNHPDFVARLADAMAILGGDFVFNWVFEVLTDLNVSAPTLRQLIKHQNNIIFETAAGEQLDVLLSLSDDPTLKQLIKVPLYKTGYYSFVGPLQFGAILAGHEEKVKVFEDYGTNLGIAYQLIDDDLGMFGSTRAIGKPNTSDLRENKPTLLRHFGFKFSNSEQKRVLSQLFGKTQPSKEDLQLVRKVLKDNGARSKALVMAQEYGEIAVRSLDESNLDKHSVSQLKELASFCLRRKY